MTKIKGVVYKKNNFFQNLYIESIERKIRHTSCNNKINFYANNAKEVELAEKSFSLI